MQTPAPSDTEVMEASVAFYFGFFGSLVLCAAIHVLAPSLTDDKSNLRLGLVVLFFGCLASATWSLRDSYERFVMTRLRWQYGDASPAIRRNMERVGARKARYFAGVGLYGTVATALWAFATLADWPLFSVLAEVQGALGWLAFLAWLTYPPFALISLQPLREAIELARQTNEDLRSIGGQIRDSTHRNRLREEAKTPAVQTIGPLAFRAGSCDWKWDDLYKNAAIFGMSGSGKTVCVLNAVLEGLIASSSASAKPCAGLILDPKGDFHDKIVALCRKHGRERDLVIVDPSDPEGSIRWNPLDSSDDPLEVAGRFGAVMQTLSDTSSNDTFWIDSSVRLVQNLISLYRLADPKTPPSLVDIYEAATSDDILRQVRLRIPDEAYETNRTARRTAEYFINLWLPMPDKTKASVRSYVSNMLGSFLVEPYDELFSGKSDVTLADVVDKGLILYVNMPIADREVMSRIVSTFIKLEYYREILKQPNKERPSFFLCDEFQSYFTVGQGRGDSDAFERTRQSNHANIIAFQNLNALLKHAPQREQVMNLLGNCATKLFLRNTDNETNQYASALFGKQIENLGSTSVSIGRGARAQGSSAAISGSDQYQERVKPEEFTALAVPARGSGVDYAEALGHLAAGTTVRMERLRWRVHPITGESRT